jgi:hypothetical protein
MSGSSFGGSLATLFSPMGAEFNLAEKHPNAQVTVQNIAVYQQAMEELRGEPTSSTTKKGCEDTDGRYPRS